MLIENNDVNQPSSDNGHPQEDGGLTTLLSELDTLAGPSRKELRERAIARLKESTLAYLKQEVLNGYKRGRDWAMNIAEYGDLLELSRSATKIQVAARLHGSPMYMVFQDEYGSEDALWGINPYPPEDEVVAAFLKAVTDFWDEVKGDLHPVPLPD